MGHKKYKSLRLKDYDYSQPGAYFITICIKDRKCLFGSISGKEMMLNDAGTIAQNEILNIPGHYMNIEIGEKIVMPNHIHMIVYIYDLNGGGKEKPPAGSGKHNTGVRQAMTPTKNIRLQDIVGSYKSGVTREIRKIDEYKSFKWQKYFHDHVIRNDRALENISCYIRLNPEKRDEDIENELYISGITENTRRNKSELFYKNLTM